MSEKPCGNTEEWMIDVESLPYSERQLIVVSEDIVAKEIRKKSQAKEANKDEDYYFLKDNEIPFGLAEGVGRAIGSGFGPTGALAILAVPAVYLLAKEAIKLWDKSQSSGMRTNVIGRTEASSLVFPPGHPRDGVLYIGHPAIKNVYFTMSDFHRVVFEHKFCEAVELLMSLGAAEIYVEHVKGWEKEFSAKLSVPLSNSGGEFSGSEKNQSKILYKAKLSGKHNPYIPENLAWYQHEPTWQAIANGRLKYGLHDFSISVSYDDDFGINAGLKGVALKSGFDLGGKFEDHESTIWRIEGKFNPRDRD